MIRTRGRACIWLYALLGSLLFAAGAGAHERSESVSHWVYAQGALRGVVGIHAREVTRLLLPGESAESLERIFAAHVARSVTAAVDGRPCLVVGEPTILPAEPGYIRVEIRAQCPRGDRLALEVGVLFGAAPSHHHFLYVEALDGARVLAQREAILTVASTRVELGLEAAGTEPTEFWGFVGLGVLHIATGLDHLAFLLALLVTARSARQILLIVSGFTLGHSVTLSLAVLGIVQVNRTAVEALIGLTIALTAALNLIQGEREGRVAALAAAAVVGALLCVPAAYRPDMPAALLAALAVASAATLWLGGLSPPAASIPIVSSRVWLAGAFGLVHGLGFAGALLDLHLPQARLVPTLLGFNLGVEVGQLVAVGVWSALALTMSSLVRRRRWVFDPGVATSAALVAVGLAWFLTRAVDGA